jgi:L-serine dehydratase
MISIFQLFSIGVGPSSSHTVGPMRAAKQFIDALIDSKKLDACEKIAVDLYGSLALTGVGHGTDGALLVGLEGALPESVDPTVIPQRLNEIKNHHELVIAGKKKIHFNYTEDLHWHKKETLPHHSNAMRFIALNARGEILLQKIYYSIGGGFIVSEEHIQKPIEPQNVPFSFHTAAELLFHCQKNNLTIAELMLKNESVFRTAEEIHAQLIHIANVMETCITRGLNTKGTLPGGLNVIRRAPTLYQKLMEKGMPAPSHQPEATLWPTVFAMAVNEENAAGGRVVTAPTNGAAGIIPAVLSYYRKFYQGAPEEKVVEFLSF